jgi:hypothetical protein
VSDSINFGYDGDILKQKVYEQVFAKDDAGNYINPTALERTKKSADYISTQNIAKAFFNTNPADSDIENVLTGKILSADYERQQREFAKTRYGHLSNLLDQGMTLESIASAYKSTASRLLELNPNAIDMSTGAFEQAVTFGEEGKKRLMTNSEWKNCYAPTRNTVGRKPITLKMRLVLCRLILLKHSEGFSNVNDTRRPTSPFRGTWSPSYSTCP